MVNKKSSIRYSYIECWRSIIINDNNKMSEKLWVNVGKDAVWHHSMNACIVIGL